MSEIEAIRRRHKDNIAYIAKREKKGRWWWMNMHLYCHQDRAALLMLIERASLRYEIDWEELEEDIAQEQAKEKPPTSEGDS